MQQMIVWTATALSLVSGGAMAHPGDHAIGFGEGLLHPWRGLDHVLAMLAIGVWAAQQGGRALLLVPISIVLTMAFGAWLGAAGLPMVGVESGVAASVLGLLILLGKKHRPSSAAWLQFLRSCTVRPIAPRSEASAYGRTSRVWRCPPPCCTGSVSC